MNTILLKVLILIVYVGIQYVKGAEAFYKSPVMPIIIVIILIAAILIEFQDDDDDGKGPFAGYSS
jgi:uncharacterized membrane protein YjdF